MRINTIINRYMFLEFFPPFIISIVFFTFVFLMQQILEITNMIVNHQVNVTSFFLFLIYAMPYFLELIIPMAAMMAILLTFLKLSADNEITALKASGISVFQLLKPVSAFLFLGYLLTTILSLYGKPWGQASFRALAVQVASANLDVGLKARQFDNSFKGVMLYVNQIDHRDKSMRHIFIEDQRIKGKVNTIIAPRGHLIRDENQPVYFLKLYNGIINQVELEKKRADSITFDTYELRLNLDNIITSAKEGPKDEKEMYPGELINYLNTHDTSDSHFKEVELEFHKKFSIPFACIALGILGVPLGIQSRSTKKSFGLGLGLFFFLLYYLLLSAGMVFGKSGHYPAAVGMWVPNILLGGLGIYLLVRVSRDNPLQMNFGLGFFRMISQVFRNSSK